MTRDEKMKAVLETLKAQGITTPADLDGVFQRIKGIAIGGFVVILMGINDNGDKVWAVHEVADFDMPESTVH